jgi:hypothetical protein
MVRVRVWSVDGQVSAWSEPSPIEAGLLHTGDWTAQFVTPDWEEDTARPQPGPLLRREFDVDAGVTKARLYVTALGVYEAQLNGVPVGDHVLDPGWTSYNHRLHYQTFDVTGLLHEGRNAIGAMLGDGWYRGRIGFEGGRRTIYGDRLALLAQLEINYADGTSAWIVTDETWRAAGDRSWPATSTMVRPTTPGWNCPGGRHPAMTTATGSVCNVSNGTSPSSSHHQGPQFGALSWSRRLPSQHRRAGVPLLTSARTS